MDCVLVKDCAVSENRAAYGKRFSLGKILYAEDVRINAELVGESLGAYDYVRLVHKIPLFDFDEEQRYARKLKQGDTAARRAMILHNLRLVISIAASYRGQGMSFDEIANEGCIGLLYAVKGFDPELGYRFSTYASLWIRQAIERAIAKHNRLVRVPFRYVRQLNKLRYARLQLGAEVNDAQLAQELGWSEEQLKFLHTLDYRECSLDEGAADAEVHHEKLPCDAACPEHGTQTEQAYALLEKVFAELPVLQQKIICLRYGLNGYDAYTLREVAEMLGMSRERVRRTQNKAQEHLRRKFEYLGFDSEVFFGSA